MLKNLLKPGVRILGLNTLFGKPNALKATYKQIPGAAGLVLDFAECTASTGAASASVVYVLPYSTGAIAETPFVGNHEVISGPFTGCVMTIFSRASDGMRRVGHVDTNPQTSQRGAYDGLKKGRSITVVAEYDTTGKIDKDAGEECIICVASGDTITSVTIKLSRYQYHKVVTWADGVRRAGLQNETMYEVVGFAT
jgi:hypothetical protein